jgi:hypothetical protein
VRAGSHHGAFLKTTTPNHATFRYEGQINSKSPRAMAGNAIAKSLGFGTLSFAHSFQQLSRARLDQRLECLSLSSFLHDRSALYRGALTSGA